MGIVRNCIHIEGIEESATESHDEHCIYYSDTNSISIPKHFSGMKNIFEMIIDLEIKSWRRVENVKEPIIVIDGIKKYKIVYAQDDAKEQVTFEEFHMPYNTYIELVQKDIKLLEIEVSILDAYYEIINCHTLYEHMIYKVTPKYNEKLTPVKIDRYQSFGNGTSFYDKNQLIKLENCLTQLVESPYIDSGYEAATDHDNIDTNVDELATDDGNIDANVDESATDNGNIDTNVDKATTDDIVSNIHSAVDAEVHSYIDATEDDDLQGDGNVDIDEEYL